MVPFNKNLISISVVIAALIIAGALIYVLPKSSGEKAGEFLPLETAVQKAVDYINKNLLSGDTKTTLIESSEVSGAYKFKIKIGEQEFESYITKDGKILFPEAIILTEKTAEDTTPEVPKDLPKTDVPDVKLFVMSYCPYGLQTEKALLPVYELLKNKAKIGVYFVDYIMHEKKEMDENLRQYCIQKEEPAKIYSYLSCFVKDGNYQKCLPEAKIDQTKLSSCLTEADKEFNVTKNYEDKKSWQGGSFPKFEVHADLNEKYGVQGSPTLVINDKVVQADRSPEGLKNVICQAFSSLPSECSQTLSDTTASPGFGEEEGGSSSGGACE